jgi:hypothetical protein
MTESDKVFSGSVTMAANAWTFIVFDTPFEYDGTSNVVLVADDNSGNYNSSPYMACSVYSTDTTQAIYSYSSYTNYNPMSPPTTSGSTSWNPYANAVLSVKNHILLGISASTMEQSIELVTGWNWCSFNVEITLDDLKAALVEALPGTTISIKSQTQNTSYNPNLNRWVGSLAWDVAKMYMIKVATNCEITLTGMPIHPAEHPVSILNGANWIGFPLNSSMTLSNAFAGFAINGDKIKSQTNNALYNGIRWQGQLNTLEPNKGYIYISNSSEGRVFTFPTSAK